MVCNPVVGMVSQQLWSFNSESQGYLQRTDGLEVCPLFSELAECSRYISITRLMSVKHMQGCQS